MYLYFRREFIVCRSGVFVDSYKEIKPPYPADLEPSNFCFIIVTCLIPLSLLWICSGLSLADDNTIVPNARPQPPIVDSITQSDSLNGILPLGLPLPAISKNGKDVAFTVTRSEYNDSGWQELRVVSQAGLRKRIVLEKYSPTSHPAQSARQSVAQKKSLKRGQALLEAGGFTPLVEFTYQGGSVPLASVYEIEEKPMLVGNWLLTYKTRSRTLCILDKEGKRVFARQIAMKKPFYCCPDADKGDKCTVGYTNIRAWGNGKVVFVEGAYWGYPDGCELDYHYWVIWPAEGKGNLETNQ
jgi:hypothetical protein